MADWWLGSCEVQYGSIFVMGHLSANGKNQTNAQKSSRYTASAIT
jgi:hypothetical protein